MIKDSDMSKTHNFIFDPSDKNLMERYYMLPVRCLLRINDTIVKMLKDIGSDGYFEFMEYWIGSKIARDLEMNCVGLVEIFPN